MIDFKLPLFSKIMIWFFLNLLLLAALFLLIFGLNVQFERTAPIFGEAANRLEAVSRLIESETDEKSREKLSALVRRDALQP